MTDFDPDSLSLEEAVNTLLKLVKTTQNIECIDADRALGRVTSDSIYAEIDVPSFSSSAMDGYALAAGSSQNSYTIVGKSLAGHPFNAALNTGECIQITTGAALPAKADAVVMQEHATWHNDTVTFNVPIKKGQFVRPPGSDTQRGSEYIKAGKRLTPADLGLLASQGINRVSVRKKITVAIMSTGDELTNSKQSKGAYALEYGKIYDSNRPLLIGLVQQLGFNHYDLGQIPDDLEAIRAALNAASDHADIILTSGGVSVGEVDFVRCLLEQHGKVNFWKIAIKPGRPLVAAQYNNTPVLGLPGNPVSVAITFDQLVRPALEKMAGVRRSRAITMQALLDDELKKQAGRVEFQRGILNQDGEGCWKVRSTGTQESHALSSLGAANCYIVLPIESQGAGRGEVVTIQLIDNQVDAAG